MNASNRRKPSTDARLCGCYSEKEYQRARQRARNEAEKREVHPIVIYHKWGLLTELERKQLGLTDDE